MSDEKKGYTVNDRRGQDRRGEPCRVCGMVGEPPHTTDYNKPTMYCVNFLRNRVIELERKLQERA